MTKLSPNFTLEEAVASQTAARRGIDNTPGAAVLWNMTSAAERLEDVRTLLGAPMRVSSWYRSPALNAAIGGSSSPTGHSSGWCIDFEAPDFGDPYAVCCAIRDSGIRFAQLIYEGTWTHISFAPSLQGDLLTARFHPGAPTTYERGILR